MDTSATCAYPARTSMALEVPIPRLLALASDGSTQLLANLTSSASLGWSSTAYRGAVVFNASSMGSVVSRKPYWELFGNTSAVSTTQSKFGSSSLYTPGTTSGVNSAISLFMDICGLCRVGSGMVASSPLATWTMECWVYPISMSTEGNNLGLFGGFQSNWLEVRLTSNTAYLAVGNGSSWLFGFTASTYTNFSFVGPGRVALTCAPSTGGNAVYNLFINGALEVSGVTSYIPNSRLQDLYLGYSSTSNSYRLNGYLDEFRFSTVVRYPSTFTPQSTPSDSTSIRMRSTTSRRLRECSTRTRRRSEGSQFPGRECASGAGGRIRQERA